MSKRDYPKHGHPNHDNATNAVDVEITEVSEAEVIAEETTENETAAETVKVKGVVGNCKKLNVRVAPNADATPICVITVKSELTIDTTQSTDEWYKVCTAAGVEGYCMKAYVTIV